MSVDRTFSLARIPEDPRRYEVDEMLATVARRHTDRACQGAEPGD